MLFITFDDTPTKKCSKCQKFAPEIFDVAKELHQENDNDESFIVAKVNCGSDDVRDICRYFSIQNMPSLILLRPEQNQYYLMWSFWEPSRTFEGVMRFIARDYHFAYTYGPLPSIIPFEQQPFFEGFTTFMTGLKQGISEELHY